MWRHSKVTPEKVENGEKMTSSDHLKAHQQTDQPLGVISADEDEDLLHETDHMVDLLADHPQHPSLFDDDEENANDEDDYVPESLANFVQEVQSNLKDARQNFLDDVNGVIMESFESHDTVTPSRNRPVEDETDRQLKQDVLDRVNRTKQQQQQEEYQDDQQFWSPEMTQTPPPNPVLNMTESQVRREVSRLVQPTPAVKSSPNLIKTAVAAELPEESKLMDLVSSMEMESEGAATSTDTNTEVASAKPSSSDEEEMAMDNLEDIQVAPSDEGEMPRTEKAGEGGNVISEQQDDGDAVPSLEQESEMEIDFASSPVSAEPEMEIDFLHIGSAEETAGELLEAPTPDHSQIIAHLGDIDESRISETTEQPHSPPKVVRDISSPSNQRQPEASPVATFSLQKEKASPLSSSSPDRARSIRRTVEMTQKIAARKHISPLRSPPQPAKTSDTSNATGRASTKSSSSKTPMPRQTKASLARAALHSPPGTSSSKKSSSSSIAMNSTRIAPGTNSSSKTSTVKYRVRSVPETNSSKKSASSSFVATRKAPSIQPRGTKASEARKALHSPDAPKPERRSAWSRSSGRVTTTTPTTTSSGTTTTKGRTTQPSRTNRPRPTRASQNREALHSPTSLSSPPDREGAAEDARARARERIRERMKQEKMVDMLKKVVSPRTQQRFSSVDERIARVRERAKQRQLEQEEARRKAIAAERPVTVTRVQPRRRILGRKTEEGTVRPSAKAPPKLTVPQAPKFATTALRGEPPKLRSPPVSMASSTEVLKRGLRGDLSIISTPRCKLTLPHAPQFATTKRHGEKVMTPGGRHGTVTLAQSDDILRSGLRKSTPAVASSTKREPGLTVPVAPKFHTTTKRQLPKSTEEMEQEMVDYYESHPFKAAPIMATDPPKPPAVAQPKRRLTCPRPFNLRTDVRGAAHVAERPKTTAEREAEEAEKNSFQFHARPMPKFSQSAPVTKSTPRTLTQPKPFRFSSSSSRARDKTGSGSQDNNSTTTSFHARPVPKSTYQYHAPEHSHHAPTSSPSPPNLATSLRSAKRHAVSEASQRRADALAAERKKKAELRQREKARQAQTTLQSATTTTLTNVEPFHLRSAERHAKYQQELQEKLQQEEEARLQQMEFHATPSPRTTRQKKSSPPPSASSS